MNVFEVRSNGEHRNVEYDGGVERFLTELRDAGNLISVMHGSNDRWLVVNPVTLFTLEVGTPLIPPPA